MSYVAKNLMCERDLCALRMCAQSVLINTSFYSKNNKVIKRGVSEWISTIHTKKLRQSHGPKVDGENRVAEAGDSLLPQLLFEF